jgi:transposase
MPFVLGPALSMKAIHGGKAKHDTLDAHKIAVLLRGGMLPQASVYPAALRATRDLRRRRRPLMRKRAELLTHIHHTHSQYNLPEIGKTIAYKANRAGVAERFADPAGHKSIAVDLALMSHDDSLLRDLEWSVLTTAKEHHTNTLDVLRTVPGIGESLSLVLRYEIHAIHRVPRVQEFVSSGRLVKGAKESAGKRDGTGGTKIGNAYLTWVFSEAAVLFLRDHPSGQNYLTRLEKTHGQGKALTVLAHHVARAVYARRKRATAFKMDKFLHGERRGAGEPAASLDSAGMRLNRAR